MSKTIPLIFLLIGLLLLSVSVSAFKSDIEPFTSKAKNAAPNHSVWQTQGYGYILEVIGEDIRFYDITKNHCILNNVETGEYPSRNLIVEGDSAELNWYTAHPVKLKRLSRLPTLCKKSLQSNAGTKNTKFSAPEVFDIFWFTFAEHFAFNDELNWNWHTNYKTWRNKISNSTSESALAEVIEELIDELGDAHAYVESDDDSFFTMNNIKWEQFRSRVIDERFSQQTEFSSLRDFYQALNEKRNNIISSYFDNQHLPQQLNRSLLWASFPHEIRYLSIDDMSEYTAEKTVQADIKEVDRAMQHIMPMLTNAKGLVIDLRWNSGGYDIVSQRILSYFIDKPLHIGSKSYRTESGFSNPENIIVYPATFDRYLGPIVVLTSGITMSAAESFLLGLAAREQVTIIGEPSNGGFSDSLPKQLPNGWSFTLSNERYFDHKGESYEYRGYPVDKNFEYLNDADLKAEKDSALIEAMKILK
ncbi:MULTISPECIES: S41 family peptidase [unclassified Pseudoalteromonas]|uniref:S41 family peptidase n=1 Tax=unclassified Pseudoalteromonas TaxID=194690 RepID=UPI0020968684|nr:S41 family peptidase [Pseudoalteromonas sp. XMcav2-N]MCO7191201.1 S41 family peptidase [Pseudoalteromonas sp. XMcav2-N]